MSDFHFEKISDTKYDIFRRKPVNIEENALLYIGCIYESFGAGWLFNADEDFNWKATTLRMLADWIDLLNENEKHI